MEISNYNEAWQNLTTLLNREAKSYSKSAIIVAICALPAFFVFPFAGLVLVAIAIYLFVNSSQSKANEPLLYRSSIRGKQYHRFQYWQELDDGHGEQREIHRRRLLLSPSACFYLKKEGPAEKYLKPGSVSKILVSESLYQQLNPGDSFDFVLTPAGDLIGWMQGTELLLLMDEKNGQLYSRSIPQVHVEQDSRTGWVLMEDLKATAQNG